MQLVTISAAITTITLPWCVAHFCIWAVYLVTRPTTGSEERVDVLP